MRPLGTIILINPREKITTASGEEVVSQGVPAAPA